MARLGLGYEDCRQFNPQIIFCSISGFGQTGPFADRAAYAPVAHAFSGFEMMMARMPNPEAPPLDNRIMIADIVGGAYSLAAIQMALVHRLRNGVGSHVDVSLVESMMTLVSMQFQDAQVDTKYVSNPHPAYPTSDGYVSIPLVSPNTFRQLFKVIGKTDWLADPEFSTFLGIGKHRPKIFAAIREWTATKTSAACEDILTSSGVPCAIYNMPHEILDHPQLKQRGTFQDLQTDSGSFKVLNLPFKISGTSLSSGQAVPKLGADTSQVVRSFKRSGSE